MGPRSDIFFRRVRNHNPLVRSKGTDRQSKRDLGAREERRDASGREGPMAPMQPRFTLVHDLY